MVERKGMIHVYTGNGKGKTTAAVGLCVRAAGRGFRCAFVQFLKGKPTGEALILRKLEGVEFFQTGRPDYDFVPTEEDRIRAEEGLKLAGSLMERCDLLVLDEVNVAVHLGLLPVEDVLKLVNEKPQKLELVLTGRHARKELIEVADYVTEFQLVKHPFYGGKSARLGIDY